MDARLLAFRKLYNIVKNSDTTDVTQNALLFSTLVYFSDDFIHKIADDLGAKVYVVLTNDLKAIHVTFQADEYVAFRGTEFSRWSNTKRVLNFIPKKNALGRKVHRGFLMAFYDLQRKLDYLISNPKSVIFTGHSLGGALSVLSAEFYGGVAISFAAPKVFFNENVKTKISHVGYRIEGDPVPSLPPAFFFMDWSLPIPVFAWRYKEKYFNFFKYHHVSKYIEHLMDIIDARNNNKA